MFLKDKEKELYQAFATLKNIKISTAIETIIELEKDEIKISDESLNKYGLDRLTIDKNTIKKSCVDYHDIIEIIWKHKWTERYIIELIPISQIHKGELKRFRMYALCNIDKTDYTSRTFWFLNDISHFLNSESSFFGSITKYYVYSESVWNDFNLKYNK